MYSSAVSESVEVLVKRSDFEMTDSTAAKSPSLCGMLDCLSTKQVVRERKESFAHKRASRRIGVEREMRVTYNQPHLVEPMKLTVYDDLPSTPMVAQQPSQVARLVSQGRKSISRASTRASLAARRRTPKSSISQPIAMLSPETCQLRRNPSFRPLQLSIYVSDKRLSDLPEFDSVSFTEEGEIRLPPRALMRTQSEDVLRPRSPILSEPVFAKPASMFEQSWSRRVSHMRQDTDSTIISTSRPPSEYDALHSHPVSWCGMPGLPATMQFATAPNISKTILSPMQEEFTPPPSGAVIINGKVLAFPDVDASRLDSETAHASLLPPACGQEGESSAPSPTIDPGPNRRATFVTKHKTKISESASILLASSANSTRTRATTMEKAQVNRAAPVEEPKTYFHTDFKTNNRINQWLDNGNGENKGRSRESSVSTVKTATTTSSFAEHRRKRSQFYQLNQVQPAAAEIAEDKKATSSTNKLHKSPTPLTLYQPFPPRKNMTAQPESHNRSKSSISQKAYSHTRSQTTSTVASTVATDVLFEQPETPYREENDAFTSAQALPNLSSSRRAYDAESMTTVDMKSRTGTMKSTLTTSSSRAMSPSSAPVEVPLYLEKELNPGVEIVSVIKGGQSAFNFRGNTPSPMPDSPKSPIGATTADVEKLMFDMCAQHGLRRVNVGVAF